MDYFNYYDDYALIERHDDYNVFEENMIHEDRVLEEQEDTDFDFDADWRMENE